MDQSALAVSDAERTSRNIHTLGGIMSSVKSRL